MSTDLSARQTDAPTELSGSSPEQTAAALTHYLGTGDLSKLTGEQRAALYQRTCQSLGINPLTRPFGWIEFYDPETKSKKLTLYPAKECADQLAYQHRIRVETLEEKIVGTLFKVVVKGTMPNGRTETNVSYLDLTDREGNPLRGQRLGNAYMKGHTKAKRRLIFGMVGMMAPPDVEDLQQARFVTVDGAGRVLDHPTEEQRYLAEHPNAARAIGEPTFETVARPSDVQIPDHADQRPRPEDLVSPKREGPRPTFKASPEDINRWCGAWFAIVDGTPWDTSKARALYVGNHTDEWPEEKRTDSLRTMFARSTEHEARDFLAKIRAEVNGWKEDQQAVTAPVTDATGRYQQLFGSDDDEARPEPPAAQPSSAPRRSSPDVHNAFALTGAAPLGPERLVDGQEYPRKRLLELYAEWGSQMQRLDRMWKPDDVKRLPDAKLRSAVAGLISQVDALDEFLSQHAEDDVDGAGAD